MIAVVYSGSRYATWKLAEKGEIIAEFKTAGINPFFNDDHFIVSLLNKTNELVTYAERIKKIFFFGAGASSADRQKIIATAFKNFFRFSKVLIEHDMKAAALATCGDNPGIVGILGSGSNAGVYTGKKVLDSNFGLGYILSDEGSANWLGRQLLKSFMNETLTDNLRQRFVKQYNLERKQILDKIYKHPHPVLFLTSFTEFMIDNRSDKFILNLVKKGFDQFIVNYIIPLVGSRPELPLHYAGTVAFHFEELLLQASAEHGLTPQTIIKAPINNLLAYYINKH